MRRALLATRATRLVAWSGCPSTRSAFGSISDQKLWKIHRFTVSRCAGLSHRPGETRYPTRSLSRLSDSDSTDCTRARSGIRSGPWQKMTVPHGPWESGAAVGRASKARPDLVSLRAPATPRSTGLPRSTRSRR